MQRPIHRCSNAQCRVLDIVLDGDTGCTACGAPMLLERAVEVGENGRLFAGRFAGKDTLDSFLEGVEFVDDRRISVVETFYDEPSEHWMVILEDGANYKRPE